MNSTATIQQDEAYYRETYTQWLRHVSRFRRWQLLAGMVSLAGGLLTLANSSVLDALGWLLVAFGAGEILAYFGNRWLWLRRMLKSKQMGISATITFTPEGLRTEPPFARGEFAWRGIEQIQNVSGGLFLRPGKGISIYIPDRAWPNAEAKETALGFAKAHIGGE